MLLLRMPGRRTGVKQSSESSLSVTGDLVTQHAHISRCSYSWWSNKLLINEV